MQSTTSQKKQSSLSIKVLDFLSLYPSPIRSFSLFKDRLLVSRKDSSQIYHIYIQDNKPKIQFLCRLPPSQYFLFLNDFYIIFTVYSVQIYVNERWQHHTFTSELLSIRVQSNTVYSFHANQTIKWNFDQNFHSQHLSKNSSPYHLTAQKCVQGYGKRIVHPKKSFTCCQFNSDTVFVGDSQGALHLYQSKYLTHQKTFHCHQASILSIKVVENGVYWSGSDSKLASLKYSNGEWWLGRQFRGQSHDVFAVNVYKQHGVEDCHSFVLTGGITTDICCYQIGAEDQLTGKYHNLVSYHGDQCVGSQGNYIVVDKRTSFEVWRVGQTRQSVRFVVQNHFAPARESKSVCMSRKLNDGCNLILVLSAEDIVGWKFSEENGLQKYMTVHGQYEFIQLIPNKSILVALRSDNFIEKIYCKTGNTKEILYSEVLLPTKMQIMSGNRILIGSVLSNEIKVYNLITKQLILQCSLMGAFTYIGSLTENSVLIKYSKDKNLYSLDNNGGQKIMVKLPIGVIRFGGWIKQKYWYGISEGKIVLVSKMNKQNQSKRKIRVKQTPRIAQALVIKNQLTIIPYSFKNMIDTLQIQPVFTKKII